MTIKMAIQTTYKTAPYYYPSVGDVLTADQLALMTAPEEDGQNWEIVGESAGVIRVDFPDMDGLRSDWLTDGDQYWRMELRPVEGNDGYYLVTDTSY